MTCTFVSYEKCYKLHDVPPFIIGVIEDTLRRGMKVQAMNKDQGKETSVSVNQLLRFPP